MLELPPQGVRVAPAVGRNREPILQVLRAHLPDAGLVLEIAAGTGEHAVHFAAALPSLQWLPADADPDALTSIAAWRAHHGPANLLAPQKLDATDPASWIIERADAIVCINMIHIAPWSATEGLMRGAARVLAPGAPLILYGPFVEPAIDTAPSNVAFDQNLRSRNPEWGLRNTAEVSNLAEGHGLVLRARLPMPANNLSLVFRRHVPE